MCHARGIVVQRSVNGRAQEPVPGEAEVERVVAVRVGPVGRTGPDTGTNAPAPWPVPRWLTAQLFPGTADVRQAARIQRALWVGGHGWMWYKSVGSAGSAL